MNTAYTTVGLGAKYKFTKDTRITVGVNNLFDKSQYRRSYDIWTGWANTTQQYPLLGRTYYATMQWDI